METPTSSQAMVDNQVLQPIQGGQPPKKWTPTPLQIKIAVIGGIIILFLLAAYGYASYLARQSYNEVVRQAEEASKLNQDEFAGWKTYRNEEYGFEFKYPGDWEDFSAFSQKISGYEMVIFFCLTTSGEDYKDWSDSYCDKKTGFATIFNIDIFKPQQWDDNKKWPTGRSIMVDNNNKYVFGYGLSHDPPDDIIAKRKYLDQILSTFKFIETDTSTWKTYRNEEYGFEFKYPGDLVLKPYDGVDRGLSYISIFTEVSLGELGYFRNFTVTIFKNTDLKNWILKTEPKDPTGGSLIKKSTDIIFLGISAKEWEVFGFDNTSKKIIFEKDGAVFSVGYEIEDPNIPNFGNYKNISDQILSTFRFLEN